MCAHTHTRVCVHYLSLRCGKFGHFGTFSERLLNYSLGRAPIPTAADPPLTFTPMLTLTIKILLFQLLCAWHSLETSDSNLESKHSGAVCHCSFGKWQADRFCHAATIWRCLSAEVFPQSPGFDVGRCRPLRKDGSSFRASGIKRHMHAKTTQLQLSHSRTFAFSGPRIGLQSYRIWSTMVIMTVMWTLVTFPILYLLCTCGSLRITKVNSQRETELEE